MEQKSISERELVKNYGKGFSLLAKMGFKVGTGLGQDGTGIVNPLGVEPVDARKGLTVKNKTSKAEPRQEKDIPEKKKEKKGYLFNEKKGSKTFVNRDNVYGERGWESFMGIDVTPMVDSEDEKEKEREREREERRERREKEMETILGEHCVRVEFYLEEALPLVIEDLEQRRRTAEFLILQENQKLEKLMRERETVKNNLDVENLMKYLESSSFFGPMKCIKNWEKEDWLGQKFDGSFQNSVKNFFGHCFANEGDAQFPPEFHQYLKETERRFGNFIAVIDAIGETANEFPTAVSYVLELLTKIYLSAVKKLFVPSLSVDANVRDFENVVQDDDALEEIVKIIQKIHLLRLLLVRNSYPLMRALCTHSSPSLLSLSSLSSPLFSPANKTRFWSAETFLENLMVHFNQKHKFDGIILPEENFDDVSPTASLDRQLYDFLMPLVKDTYIKNLGDIGYYFYHFCEILTSLFSLFSLPSLFYLVRDAIKSFFGDGEGERDFVIFGTAILPFLAHLDQILMDMPQMRRRLRQEIAPSPVSLLSYYQETVLRKMDWIYLLERSQNLDFIFQIFDEWSSHGASLCLQDFQKKIKKWVETLAVSRLFPGKEDGKIFDVLSKAFALCSHASSREGETVIADILLSLFSRLPEVLFLWKKNFEEAGEKREGEKREGEERGERRGEEEALKNDIKIWYMRWKNAIPQKLQTRNLQIRKKLFETCTIMNEIINNTSRGKEIHFHDPALEAQERRGEERREEERRGEREREESVPTLLLSEALERYLLREHHKFMMRKRNPINGHSAYECERIIFYFHQNLIFHQKDETWEAISPESLIKQILTGSQ